MASKQFNQAPLPFVGQKRMFLQHFRKILNQHIANNGDGWTIVDVFGGSGLLSHTARNTKSAATVIYNDFDGYSERLQHIGDINRLRADLYALVDNAAPKNKRLSKALKSDVIHVIQNFDGYKDLNCLSSWLLFSGQQVGNFTELFNRDFWHCIRKSDYPEADGYLEGITVTNESFDSLIPRFAGKDKVLLILDPPYLCTRQDSYKQATYFDLIDFLKLINLTKPPYIFFSSTKSEFIRFIDYMIDSKADNWRSFDNCHRIAVNASASYSGQYEDNLVFKF
ncbi:hypothetical protein CBG46_09175 [Actinobacillus succinogenes]|uniref:D12 class N6 adenine-specific DNA methyltransferase n=1 Tax=Actinobacillus succinogenes (strain ATCC 55618 / DSM 22257 / CCUG 43843 / 130Z) TaxID=339671 RepID=A6VP53_ACTSZ|nr:DNA adenine methylase [Actinobacillus succinogenes]ABR74750.1 conserved hypothetical protein [Actinobacillus succinogenes 130Z]PHI40830.1 hypothetical protein CBG46_09175 [Actinobacillus succinogenes]